MNLLNYSTSPYLALHYTLYFDFHCHICFATRVEQGEVCRKEKKNGLLLQLAINSAHLVLYVTVVPYICSLYLLIHVAIISANNISMLN